MATGSLSVARFFRDNPFSFGYSRPTMEESWNFGTCSMTRGTLRSSGMNSEDPWTLVLG